MGEATGLPSHLIPQWAALTDLIAGDAVEHVLATADRTFSAINATGVPVQFSVAIGGQLRAARVLGEAGRPGLSMRERLEYGGRQVRAVLELLHHGSAIAAVDRVLEILLPRDTAAMRGWTGALWCGVAVGADGRSRTRLYLNQRWGDMPVRIDRLRRAIDMVAGRAHAGHWQRASGWLNGELTPYGVALDVGTHAVQGIKVYSAARTAHVDSIAQYLCSALPKSELTILAMLLDKCERLGGWNRPRMVMPCLEFGDAREVRAKVDMALCALPTSDIMLDRMIRSTLASMELPSEDYDAVLSAMSPRPLNCVGVERLQYLSIACNPNVAELTVYFSPDLG